jgi:hypothetical protein
MTLIEQRNGDGSLAGRCDARCYEAKNPDCDCICGGKNHGAGLKQAMDNTSAMTAALLEKTGVSVPSHNGDLFALGVLTAVRT